VQKALRICPTPREPIVGGGSMFWWNVVECVKEGLQIHRQII